MTLRAREPGLSPRGDGMKKALLLGNGMNRARFYQYALRFVEND